MSGAVRATKCCWLCPMSRAAPCRTGRTGSTCNSGAAGLPAGKATGDRTGHVAIGDTAMSKPKILVIIAIVLASTGASPLLAQDGPNRRPLLERMPSYTAWYYDAVSYTHLRAHETGRNLVCRLLLEKKKKNK